MSDSQETNVVVNNQTQETQPQEQQQVQEQEQEHQQQQQQQQPTVVKHSGGELTLGGNTAATTTTTAGASNGISDIKSAPLRVQEVTLPTSTKQSTKEEEVEVGEGVEGDKKAVPSSLYMKANLRSVEFVYRTALTSFTAPEDEAVQQAKKAFDLGVYFLKRADLATASTNFKTAVELAPNIPTFQIFMGFVLLDSDLHDQALECFNRAIHQHAMEVAKSSSEGANNSALLDAFLGLGHLYYDSGDNEKCVENYTRALQLDPTRCDTLNGLGRAYNRQGKYSESAATFTKCLEVDPQYVKAWNNLGVVNVALGKREDALECFNKAVQIHHGFPEAWQNMGWVYQESGNQHVADQCFRNADYTKNMNNKESRNCNVADCSLM